MDSPLHRQAPRKSSLHVIFAYTLMLDFVVGEVGWSLFVLLMVTGGGAGVFELYDTSAP